MPPTLPTTIDIREPRWDQSTFQGRAKHFFTVTDPRNLLLSGAALDEARRLVLAYRAGTVPPGLTEDELWRAKYIYDSAFHPDTGEKMLLIGRMSAQVPMNMTITGCMLTFYRELKVGIPITDENGNRLAIPPVIMNVLEKRAFLKRYPYLNAPLQVGLVGLCLVFATPLCCALFPQKSSMQVSRLEPSVQAQIREVDPQLHTVYFNKGL
uniref:Sideroflexin-3 n=1 Tax=Gallus gallus TaxID=9031 RepID=A0A8V0Z4D9_CHICK